MDKLHKNTGGILPNRDWKSKYYRILDLESTQVRHLSKCYFLVGFLAHHVLFMWPWNLDLSIYRDALGRTQNNHNEHFPRLIDYLRIYTHATDRD